MLWAQLGGARRNRDLVRIRGDGPHDWADALGDPGSALGHAGLYAYYRGMATGTMSVVAPIAGASAIVPVIFGIATGDRPRPVQIAGIACAIVGVALASQERQAVGQPRRRGRRARAPRCDRFRLYFPPMHAAGAADPWWGSFIFRLTATAIVLAAVAVRRPKVRLAAWPLLVVIGVGLGDTLGNLLFAAAPAGGLVSVTSVLASLYPIVTVILAAL